MFLEMQDFGFAQSDSILSNKIRNLLEDVAISPAPTAQIESMIQINKAYTCDFLSMKMLLKLNLSGLRPGPRRGRYQLPFKPPS